MNFITELPYNDIGLFDCICTSNEIFVPAHGPVMLDYMVTEYPRLEATNNYTFVYGLFECESLAFSNTQDIIVTVAKELFTDSLPLNDYEQNVLYMTLRKSIKQQATLAGRK